MEGKSSLIKTIAKKLNLPVKDVSKKKQMELSNPEFIILRR